MFSLGTRTGRTRLCRTTDVGVLDDPEYRPEKDDHHRDDPDPQIASTVIGWYHVLRPIKNFR